MGMAAIAVEESRETNQCRVAKRGDRRRWVTTGGI
jgi:hypothetical protein